MIYSYTCTFFPDDCAHFSDVPKFWFVLEWTFQLPCNGFLRATARSAKRILAIVNMSIRLSVTIWYRFKPRWDRLRVFTVWHRYSSWLWPNFMSLGDKIQLERGRQRGVPPRNRYFTTINSSSVRTLQLDTDLLLIINTNCWRAFRGTNIDDLERHWNRKIGVSVIFCDFRLRCTFEEWIFAEITGDSICIWN